jgi:hypothetical protein
LNKGTTKDSFQMAGQTPADSDKLKTNVKGTLTTEANRFKIAGAIPSGSGPLLTSKQTFYDRRQKLAGHYPGSNHPARTRFEKTQQINLQCPVSPGLNRFPKT